MTVSDGVFRIGSDIQLEKAWPSTRLPRALSHTEIQSPTPRGLYINHMQVNVFLVSDILLGALRDVTESQQ
jgi:hypothetical protein